MLFIGPDGPGKDLEWTIVRPGGFTVGFFGNTAFVFFVDTFSSPPTVAIATNGC